MPCSCRHDTATGQVTNTPVFLLLFVFLVLFSIRSCGSSNFQLLKQTTQHGSLCTLVLCTKYGFTGHHTTSFALPFLPFIRTFSMIHLFLSLHPDSFEKGTTTSTYIRLQLYQYMNTTGKRPHSSAI